MKVQNTVSHSIVVIGGGAAGFFSAIHAKETYPDADVVILEASSNVLNKVKISGGGRCNVTHACFDSKTLVSYYPRGGKALFGMFHRFQPEDTVAWFEQRGVALKTEQDNRMFPVSNSSETIVDALMHAAISAGVRIFTKRQVVSVKKCDQRFCIETKQDEVLEANALILATGSSKIGYAIAKDLGHTIVPPVPSLFTFTINDERLRSLSGLSVSNVSISVEKRHRLVSQSGPLLITHWGLSGPAVIKLSAWGARQLYDLNYKFDVFIDWIPSIEKLALDECFVRFSKAHPKKALGSTCPLRELPLRLWQYLLSGIAIESGVAIETRWEAITLKQRTAIVNRIKACRLKVSGKSRFKDEFVTAGGIDLAEINGSTMESKRCPGLFAVGELLNIDGVTGGFNFQNAWTSGYLAGIHCLKKHYR